MNWNHKDVWRVRDDPLFSVEVTRHTAEPAEYSDSQGIHRWAVYAYLYPAHPFFRRFDGYRPWDWCRQGMHIPSEAARDFPMHGGPSRVLRHFDGNGRVTSIEVGADYIHLRDDRFTHMATKEDASEVFNDAAELVAFLRGVR